MDFSSLFKQAGRVAAENSPAILTALGVTGTLTTAVLAAKAAFASVEVLKDAEEAKREEFFGDQTDVEGEVVEIECEPLTTKEQVQAVWKLYAPAAVSAAMTVSAIIFAGRIQDRRNAALVSAYTFAEKSLKEYRDKAVSKPGGKKRDQEIRDEIAQDGVTNNPLSSREVIVISDGNVLCRDAYSGRYFTSDMESLRKAENNLNWEILNNGYASLSDWWHLINVESTSESDELGWNTDTKFEIEFSTALTDTNKPCIVTTFRPAPVPRFYRNNH